MLDALAARADAERTIVVYTSDHGEMGGAHRMAQKRFLYEESVRVPLVLVYPGVEKGTRTDRLASNVDLAPTLAALAGVKWPTALPGKDLLAAISQRAATRRCSRRFPSRPRAWPPSVRAHLTRMVRTRDWKYVLYPSGAEELYDTAADPSEVKNLAAAPEQARAPRRAARSTVGVARRDDQAAVTARGARVASLSFESERRAASSRDPAIDRSVYSVVEASA